MALRTFETEDAVYYLGLGDHSKSSEPMFKNVDFSSLDFFVFEDGFREDKKDGSYLERVIAGDRQYGDLFERLETEAPKTKLYGVDIAHSSMSSLIYHTANSIPTATGFCLLFSSISDLPKNVSRRTFLKGLAGSFLANDLLMFANNEESEISPITTYHNIKSNIPPLSIETSLRDSAIAKKTSEYLVSKHKKEGKKVQATLLFGANHSGIETKLKHSWVRDATLSFFSYLPEYCSREQLNEVREIIRDEEGNLRTIYNDCQLF